MSDATSGKTSRTPSGGASGGRRWMPLANPAATRHIGVYGARG